MKQLDNIVRNTLKAATIPTSNTNSTSSTTTLTPRCTIFEDEQPSRIHKEWYFSAPIAAATSSFNIDVLRLLKNTNIIQGSSRPMEERNLMAIFSNEVSRCKRRVTTITSHPKEDDLLCYATLIDLLTRVFENNATAFCYEVADSEAIRSSDFLYEYIHALLALLAHYNSLALDLGKEMQGPPFPTMTRRRELLRHQGRSYHLCTEILTEILNQCKAPRGSSYKLLYTEPPRSLSMDPRHGVVMAGTTDVHEPATLSMGEFIASFLGGISSIEARLALCVAKKSETLYELFMTDKEEGEKKKLDDEALQMAVSRMSSIYHAYKQAYEKVEASAENHGLYQHARFMAHLWLCRAQMLLASHHASPLLEALASATESTEETNEALEVMARLWAITKEGQAMEEHEKEMLDALDEELEETYNELIGQLEILTKQFDTELYENRHIKEKRTIECTLPISFVVPREQSVFVEVRRAALKKYLDEQPGMIQAQQVLHRIYDQLIKTDNTVIPTTIATTSSTSTMAAVTTNEMMCMEHSQKLAHFIERAWTLEWLLSCYSLMDGTFEISSDYYDVFQKQLVEVREAIKTIKSVQ